MRIGIVVHLNKNVGNQITNFALYHYLKNNGFQARLITMPKECDFFWPRYGKGSFKYSPYTKDDEPIQCFSRLELCQLSHEFDTFVLGSDQLWHPSWIKSTKGATTLDWVSSEKCRISYATSFGTDCFEASNEEVRKIKKRMARFDKISVREKSGIDIMRNDFCLEAQHVADPVFLCSPKVYQEMADRGGVENYRKPYVAAYFLSPSNWKDKIVLEIAGELTQGRQLLILNFLGHEDGNYSGLLTTLHYPTVENWLAMIRECSFLVTDSFHGMCFALIFQKPFLVLSNSSIPFADMRMRSMLTLLDMEQRMHNAKNCLRKNFASLVDLSDLYGRVDRLNKFINHSKDWFAEALTYAANYRHKETGYDRYFRQHLINQNAEKRNRSKKFFADWGVGSDTQVIVWGTGRCFQENIELLVHFCDLSFVCDNDESKWNREVFPGLVCVSPKTINEKRDLLIILMLENPVAIIQVLRSLPREFLNKVILFAEWRIYMKLDDEEI